MKDDNQDNRIIIYESESGQPKISVRLDGENLWLTQAQIAELFGVQRPAVTKHLKNIFFERELDENVVCSILEQTTLHGAIEGKTQSNKVKFYNLDVIIAVGYRINSKKATQFRIWATKILKDYIIKGFAMDDERLKNLGGGGYWKELLDRIRDIRSSERVLYRQVLDLYATSLDYDSKASESIEFFKIVQNKLHYAAHGHTAAEIIAERADAGKPFMGLLTFSRGGVIKRDIAIAKNYLTEKELKILNNLVSGYFDFAEVQAMKQRPMYMRDYIKQLDNILVATGEKLLRSAGSVSNKQAVDKAESEYKKFQQKNLSEVEKSYLKAIKGVESKIKKKTKT